MAAFDLAVRELELRLDQHHALRAWPQTERQTAEHVAGGDEADVDREEVERPLGLVERQLPPVDPLERRHARVGAERRVQLSMPDVDRQDAGRTMGEQRLGESTRRRADVDRPRAAHGSRQPETRERCLQFSARAADRHGRDLYLGTLEGPNPPRGGRAGEAPLPRPIIPRSFRQAAAARLGGARALLARAHRGARDLSRVPNGTSVSRPGGAGRWGRSGRSSRRRAGSPPERGSRRTLSRGFSAPHAPQVSRGARSASDAARPTVASAARVMMPTRNAPVTTGKQETPCSHMICAASSSVVSGPMQSTGELMHSPTKRVPLRRPQIFPANDAGERSVVQHQQVIDSVVEGEPPCRGDHSVRRQRVELSPHYLSHATGTDFGHDIHDVPPHRKSSGRAAAGTSLRELNKRRAKWIGRAGLEFPPPRASVASPGPCGCYQPGLWALTRA